MSTLRKDLHEQNRLSWNAATKAHNSHKHDQAKFLREGGSTLYPEEISLIGDVRGKKLLHLQCNAGQDTLSWALRGAEVTGVDISDEAISFAQNLSAESGIPGTFLRSDVYDWLENAPPESFDIVFCSYGAICWLSDIRLWGKGVTKVLRPGGRFATVESHPFMLVFGDEFNLQYEYSGGVAVTTPGVHDYVAAAGEALAPSGYVEGVKDFKSTNPDVAFEWGLAEIFMALIEPGLALEKFVEYPYTKWLAFGKMTPGPDKNFYLPAGMPQIPLMFGAAFTKRADR